jgi:Ca-activated chloride channel family protein
MRKARLTFFALCLALAGASGLASGQTQQAPASNGSQAPKASQNQQQNPPQNSQQSSPLSQSQNSSQNPSQSQEPQVAPLRITTGLVKLVATVSDRRHNFVTDLDQKDFKVMEDGRPQAIQFFGRETNLPLRVGLLLDTSNSIRMRLHFEQDAAIDFLENTLVRHRDMAFLMTFDNEPQVIQDFTDDPSILADAIEKQRAGGGTSLNDAIYQASQKLEKAPLPKGDNTEVRRVLVVISDGDDNLSDRATSEAVEMAERAEVAIYSISTSTDWLAVTTGDRPQKLFKTPGDQTLENFSVQTGGRVFFPYKVDDLAESFHDIGNELRSQYFIAYAPGTPAEGGQYRKIDVQVPDRKGLTVRTRKGYYPTAGKAENAPSGE